MMDSSIFNDSSHRDEKIEKQNLYILFSSG